MVGVRNSLVYATNDPVFLGNVYQQLRIRDHGAVNDDASHSECDQHARTHAGEAGAYPEEVTGTDYTTYTDECNLPASDTALQFVLFT